MVIFYENNKSIQIKRFLSKSTRVPHAKFYICKKVIFFENFYYRATLKQNTTMQGQNFLAPLFVLSVYLLDDAVCSGFYNI